MLVKQTELPNQRLSTKMPESVNEAIPQVGQFRLLRLFLQKQ